VKTDKELTGDLDEKTCAWGCLVGVPAAVDPVDEATALPLVTLIRRLCVSGTWPMDAASQVLASRGRTLGGGR
jgi:hypothetical protein